MIRAARRALLTGTAVLGLGIVPFASANAQTGTPESDVPAAVVQPIPDQDQSQDEIVVTAQRREQRLQDVPISIEVISGETIEDLKATDVRSVMNYVPNVFVQTTAGNHVIYIRGFGSPPSNFAFDQSVSLYVDGIYAGRNRQAMAPFFDLQRMEVLRGPQGALFGKNTPAGAISVISAGPTDRYEAGLTGAYNFDLDGPDVSGFVSVPISDTLGVRLAGRIVQQDGYIRNLATGHDDPETRMQLVRGTVRWDPSSAFDFTAKAEYGNQEIVGGQNVSSPLTTEQQPRTERFLEDSALGQEGNTNESVIVSGTGNLRLGDYTVTSVTGYSWFDANIVNGFDQTIPAGGVAGNSVYNSFPERFSQISQEVRLLSPVGRPLEFLVGAYYDHSRYFLTQLGGFNINVPVLRYFGLLQTNFKQKASSKSVFGQVTYRLIEALRVVGSLRYTQTDKQGSFGGRLVYGPFALRPVNTTANGKISEGLLDPSLTFQYDVTPDVMVYATYGRGSKSGGFVSNTYGTTDATFIFRPERSRNYEAGIKSTFFNRRLTLNVSAYDTQFKNLQVSVYNSALQIFQTGNAASATAKGVEAAAIWNPSRDFGITASGAYNDLKYDDYPGAACLASQPITECNPADRTSFAANNLAGFRPALTSKWTGNLQGRVGFDLPGDLRLETTGILAGRSRFFNADNQHPVYGFQRGYVKLDMRVQLAPQDERWHFAIIGKNLTNELTTGSSFGLPFPITSTPRAILYLEPSRNIAVEAGIRF